jgi:hypothetical protein
MQARHDRPDRAVERARDFPVAEIFDLGQLEDVTLRRQELREGRA